MGLLAAAAAAILAFAVLRSNERTRSGLVGPVGGPGVTAAALGRERTPAPPPPRLLPPPPGPLPLAVAAAADAEPPPPLTQKELLDKAGEKDGDTTYSRLLEEAFDLIPSLTEAERRDLRAVARKRQARLKLVLRDQPSRAGASAALPEDDFSAFEQRLLGPDRYPMYQRAVTGLLGP